MDSILFSRQMLHPQNWLEIEKRWLQVRKNHKNDFLKRRKLPLLRPDQRVRFQDPIPRSGRSHILVRQTMTTGSKTIIKHIVTDKTDISSS
jgi:hypothetical protein